WVPPSPPRVKRETLSNRSIGVAKFLQRTQMICLGKIEGAGSVSFDINSHKTIRAVNVPGMLYP
ncbi:hypothetical protein RZS08_59015, partial [Arthrospira platensis SPKY1]|nr:hypothetical protein [Arthrospira platensis SPKY1]